MGAIRAWTQNARGRHHDQTTHLIAFERAERETDPARRRELLTFVLVGGGPTGVELAGTLAEIARQTLRDEFRSIDTSHARIVLVEASRILATFPELQSAARASLTRLGIEIREGVAVTHIDAHGVMLGTERLDAGTIVGGRSRRVAARGHAGSAPRSGRPRARRARPLDSRTSRGLRGWRCGRLSSSRRQAAPVWRRRRCRARRMRRRTSCVDPGEPSVPFVYRNLGNMAIVGRGSAVADLPWARFSGLIGWLSWLFLHIVMLIGFATASSCCSSGLLLLDLPARCSAYYGRSGSAGLKARPALH